MGQRRGALALALVGLTVTAIYGCRTVRPEAGLPREAFEGETPKLVSNDRGFWFAVTDQATSMTPWVMVGEEDPELLYALPVGSRTARLLPATPFSYSRLDELRGQTVPMRWVETPVEEGPPDRIGFLSGKPGDEVVWNGEAPADETPVVLLAATPKQGAALNDWILGIGVLSASRVTQLQTREDAAGPYLVVAQGSRPAHAFSVVTLVDEQVEGSDIAMRMSSTPAPAAANRWSLRPIALREGSDAIVSRGQSEGHLTVMMTAPVVLHGLPLALSEEAFEVPREHLGLALRGLAAVRDGRFLTAAYLFDRADITTEGSTSGPRLRIAELLASAGYVDWTRSVLLSDVVGLDGDTAYYLARAHLLGGDLERAADFGQRAFERFHFWSGDPGNLGLAQTGMLLARLASAEGDWKSAARQAMEAASRYAEAGDDMRAAEAELRAANYWLEALNPSAAVKAGLLARSRFFHGHSPYWSGFAEIALADTYRRLGEVEEAGKMARFAALRFDDLGDPVARNRALMAEGRVLAESARGQGVRELEIAFERADKLGDEIGGMDAAASLIVLGAAAPQASGAYGLAILRNLGHVDDPFTRDRAAQALALLCGRGFAEVLSNSDAAPWEVQVGRQTCDAVVDGDADDAMLLTLVGQGWAALGGGDAEQADSLTSRAVAALDENTRLNTPKLAAEALFLQAAVQRTMNSPDADASVDEAIALLARSIDPTRLAVSYREIANRFTARGQTWLAARLLNEGIAAAGEQEQAELRRELAMQVVQILHADGDLDGAREAIRIAEPILESAGATSSPMLAHLWTYQVDVLKRLDRDADASVAEAKAARALAESDGLTQVDVTLLAARHALDRGDLVRAKALLGRTEGLEAGLPTGLATEPGRRLLKAQMFLVRAEIARREGEQSAAHDAFQRASAALLEVAPTEEVLGTRIVALAGAGQTATTDESVGDIIRVLEELRSQARNEMPALVPAATQSLAELEIWAGRPGRAFELIQQATASGSVAAPNADDAFCLEARAAALSGHSDAVERVAACASRARGAQAAEAKLLAALLSRENGGASRQGALTEISSTYDATLSGRAKQRIALASELHIGTARPDPKREARLRTTLEAAASRNDHQATVRAVEDLAIFLIEIGRPIDASNIIDANSAAFYSVGGNRAGTLARLRAQAIVASLDPLAAFNYSARAISETPDMSADDEAETLLVAAKNAVLLGMWQHARSLLDDAETRATEAKNRRLVKRIQEFAKRFELPLTD